ncbi:MAG: histidine kinase [Natronospirillum sp.]
MITKIRPIRSHHRARAIGSGTLCTDNAVWFMALIAQLLALVIALLMGSQGFWTRLALASLYCQWSGLVGIWCLCQLQRRGLDGSQRRHWWVYWATLGAVASTGLASGHLLYDYWFPETSALNLPVLAQHWAASLIFSGLLLRYWFLQNALTLRQQATTQAELDALQARLNPHFLFNALNSVAALVRQDPQRAEAAVEHLADLMRASLQSHQAMVTLQEEIDLTQAYVALEQARFGKRLRIQWQVDPQLLTEQVPILSLQPLVENAVKHGIAPNVHGGVVDITVNAAVRVWMVRVKNPLPDAPAQPGNRFALQTLQARGQAMMGSGFSLSTRLESGHFIAQMTFTFPPPEHQT